MFLYVFLIFVILFNTAFGVFYIFILGFRFYLWVLSDNGVGLIVICSFCIHLWCFFLLVVGDMCSVNKNDFILLV